MVRDYRLINLKSIGSILSEVPSFWEVFRSGSLLQPPKAAPPWSTGQTQVDHLTKLLQVKPSLLLNFCSC